MPASGQRDYRGHQKITIPHLGVATETQAGMPGPWCRLRLKLFRGKRRLWVFQPTVLAHRPDDAVDITTRPANQRSSRVCQTRKM